jgi:hypothetical protein
MIVETKAFWLACSAGCQRISDVFFAVEDAADVAEQEGWLVAGRDEHLCPRCRQSLAKDRPLTIKQRLRIAATG